jgi:hypothetical protein
MRRGGNPSLGSDMDSPEPEQQTNNEGRKTNEQIPPAFTELQMPVSPPNAHKTKQSEKHWIDYAKFGLEVCGFIVLCVYAYFTIRIYCANKEAADAAKSAAQTASDGFALTKQITEGTSEAVCEMSADCRDMTKGTCPVSFFNIGRVTAKSFRAHVEFSIRKLPSNIQIGKTQASDFSQDELLPRANETTLLYAPGHGDIMREIDIPILRLHESAIDNGTEALMAKATITYDNGFGTVRTTPYCQEFVYGRAGPSSSPTRIRMVVPCEGQYGIASFVEEQRKIARTQAQEKSQK